MCGAGLTTSENFHSRCPIYRAKMDIRSACSACHFHIPSLCHLKGQTTAFANVKLHGSTTRHPGQANRMHVWRDHIKMFHICKT